MTHWIDFLGDDAIHALGWTFVHSLWQGSLIALVMMLALARIPARNAKARYGVAVGSLIGVLLMALITFVLLYDTTIPSPIAEAQIGQQGAVAGTSSGFSQWLDANVPVFVSIWIVGMLLLIVRFGAGLLYIERLKKSSSNVAASIEQYGAELARQLQYRYRLRIAETQMVSIPVVVGFLKPVILFPIGAVNQLSIDEVQAVLAHELAHLVRNDFIQNLIQSLIEIVFYYHPAVWWISAVVRAERENCCDDLAIKACGSSLTYARALVHLQDLGQSSPALALPFSGSKNHLLNRIKRILNQPQNKSNVMEKVTATGLLVLCLIFASFSGNADTVDPINEVLVSNDEAIHFTHAFTDTVPPYKVIVHQRGDGKDVQLIYQNGEVTSFKINGVEVPADEYAGHQEILDELMEEAKTTPPLPPPPAPHLAPIPNLAPVPSLPANPGNIWVPKPPLPPPAPRFKKRTETLIIREIDENGNKVYRIERDGEGKSNIVIDEASSIIHIDGQEVVIDADSIIIIEEVESVVPNMWAYSDSRTFFTDSTSWPFAASKFKFAGDAFYKVMPKVWGELYSWDGTVAPNTSDAAYQYLKAHELYNQNWDQEKLNKFYKENNLKLDGEYKAFFEYSDQLKGYTKDLLDQNGVLHDSKDQLKGYLLELHEYSDARAADRRDVAPDQIARRLKDNRRLMEKSKIYSRDANSLNAIREYKKDGNVFFATPESFVVASDAIDAYTVISQLKHGNGGIINAMTRDGLLDPDEEYAVILSEKKLKINGKRMPDSTLEKYKKIFERTYGHSITGKTKIEISSDKN